MRKLPSFVFRESWPAPFIAVLIFSVIITVVLYKSACQFSIESKKSSRLQPVQLLRLPQTNGHSPSTAEKELGLPAELKPLVLSSRRNHSYVIQSEVRTAINMAVHVDSDEFDAIKVWTLFMNCKEENEDLSIHCYTDAYEELCKLFRLFGTVFGFVTSDVVEKIGILRDYANGTEAESYRTVQSMVQYEVDHKLTVQKKKASGCRTLLRLHRALEFISAFIARIRDTTNSAKFSAEAIAAYDETLAKHHPWLVRKAVHIAMYVLPSRQQLLLKMKVDDNPQGMEQISALIKQLNEVFRITEKLYADNHLLDLP